MDLFRKYLDRSRSKIVATEEKKAEGGEPNPPSTSKSKSKSAKICPECGEMMRQNYDGSWSCPMGCK